MAYLLDTGILLRLADLRDIQHAVVFESVQKLISKSEELLTATQNVAEFCNVITRPIANNGMCQSPQDAIKILEAEIQTICTTIPENDLVYSEFKRLVSTYSVAGKQVHGARLVAIMLAWQIESILTLNDRDFRRYEPEGIKIITPAELIARLELEPATISAQ
jgi:predicted nucleic acid-binding protein